MAALIKDLNLGPVTALLLVDGGYARSTRRNGSIAGAAGGAAQRGGGDAQGHPDPQVLNAGRPYAAAHGPQWVDRAEHG